MSQMINKIFEEQREFIDDLLSDLISQFVVGNDLDKEFYKDPIKIFLRYKDAIKDGFDWDEDVYITIQDVYQEVSEYKSFLSSLSLDDFKKFSDMYLYKAVTIFERMVNNYYQTLLELKYNFGIPKCNEIIQKLKTTDKLGWFLEVMIGKSYIQEPGWEIVRSYLDARNFFIHYKPEKARKYDKFGDLLNQEKLFKFLDEILVCHDFLKENNDKLLEHYERILNIKNHFLKVFAKKAPDII